MTSRLEPQVSCLNRPEADDFTSASAPRVVLVDPREERRAITSGVISRCRLLNVVGVAADLGEAEHAIIAGRADTAIVEIQPMIQGLATIAALREHFPDLRILVCSFHADAATREAARMHGADGYLAKPLQVDDLLELLAGLAPTRPLASEQFAGAEGSTPPPDEEPPPCLDAARVDVRAASMLRHPSSGSVDAERPFLRLVRDGQTPAAPPADVNLDPLR